MLTEDSPEPQNIFIERGMKRGAIESMSIDAYLRRAFSELRRARRKKREISRARYEVILGLLESLTK